jgi:hypothetical protein
VYVWDVNKSLLAKPIEPKTSGREHNVSQEQNPDLLYVANAAMLRIVLIITTQKQKKGGDKSLDKFKNQKYRFDVQSRF